MHDNVIIGLAVLAAFTFSIMLALYGMRLMDRERQWRPRRYGISAREVPCSFCGKSVRAEAVMCRHCHRRLDESPELEAEAGEGETAGALSVPRAADNRLIAAGATSFVIENEEYSKNQALAWLDTAFQQLSVKPAPVAFGPVVTDRAAPHESPSLEIKAPAAAPLHTDAIIEDMRPEVFAGTELAVRSIGPLSQQPGVDVGRAKSWWTGRKEWAYAAGTVAVALIVGGSTFLVGPSNAPVERAAKPSDYVTFDVSERAPLYTGPQIKDEAKPGEPLAVAKAAVVAPIEAAAAKPDTVAVVKPEPVIEAAKPVPVAALPQLPPAPAPEKAMEIPVSMAVAAPQDSSARSEPVAAPPPRPEEWASSVARAIKPAQSKELIVAVQRLIRAEGYDPGTIDGVVGPRTRRAIQQYQRNGGLKQTGEIDRDLLAKLNLADRTIRVVGPMNGVSAVAATTPARPSRPVVEWTK